MEITPLMDTIAPNKQSRWSQKVINILDGFVVDKFRGLGNPKELIKFLMGSETIQYIEVWSLARDDAHRLYEKSGFSALGIPECHLEYITTIKH